MVTHRCTVVEHGRPPNLMIIVSRTECIRRCVKGTLNNNADTEWNQSFEMAIESFPAVFTLYGTNTCCWDRARTAMRKSGQVLKVDFSHLHTNIGGTLASHCSKGNILIIHGPSPNSPLLCVHWQMNIKRINVKVITKLRINYFMDDFTPKMLSNIIKDKVHVFKPFHRFLHFCRMLY